LHNRIRALSPQIGAHGELHGRRVIVWRSRVVGDRLEILEVQPEGRRRMTLTEFERGLRG
jgi:methionyl-tRNA formyltransferase